MKHLVTVFLFVALSVSAAALDDGQAVYVGGTVPALTVGAVGILDTTPETTMTFKYSSAKLDIPYASINSFHYSTEVAHHLGVIPAIAVGLVKKRERRHIFRISFHGDDGVSQVVLFEVSKHRSPSLSAILENRASKN